MENEGELARLVLCVLLTLLAMVVVLRTRAGSSFEYRGQVRWSAPWGNPNMFGMLMGTGVTLAAGQALRAWLSADLRTSNAGHRSPGMLWRTIHAALLVFAAVLSGTGLVMSYSRGAWVGTLCGIAYLMWRGVQSPLSEASNVSRSICISGLRRNWLPLSLVFLSLGALAFWSFRQTERAIPRRAFSLANVNDFSWRNRVASWEGALRMIGSKPISGFGWNMQDPVYAELYLSPRLAVGRPIRANDYLTLGATLGVPALVCFIVYVGLSLRSNTLCCAHSVRAETRDNRPRSTESVKMVCRAAVVVLLVGFWFEGADGGLLRLPTGSLFWILSELGRET